MTSAAQVFAALGDPTRLELVHRLATDGPDSIAGLTGGTKLTRQAITKHLHALEAAGVVRSTRVGRERVFEVDPTGLGEGRRSLESISVAWGQTLERLRAYVESDEDR